MSDFLFPEVFEVTQIGVEDEEAKGTKVAATKRFFALMFDIDPKIPTNDVRQAGNMYPVGMVAGKGHTEGTVKGDASVEDLIYIFSTCHCLPEFDGTDALFAPLSRAFNPYKTLTFEKGQSGEENAGSFGFGVLQEYEIDIVPDKQVGFTGKIIGQTVEPGITLSDGVETLSNSVLFPTEADVFVATSEAALLDNELKPFSVKWKVSKTKGDVYRVTSGDQSYSDLSTTAPAITVEIVVPKGSASNTYLNSIFDQQLYYIEMQMRGGNADDDEPFSVTIRAPFFFTNPGEGAAQDVHTATFTGVIAHEEAFNTDGGALLITCHSNLTAL